jgi:hypothetical protein
MKISGFGYVQTGRASPRTDLKVESSSKQFRIVINTLHHVTPHQKLSKEINCNRFFTPSNLKHLLFKVVSSRTTKWPTSDGDFLTGFNILKIPKTFSVWISNFWPRIEVLPGNDENRLSGRDLKKFLSIIQVCQSSFHSKEKDKFNSNQRYYRTTSNQIIIRSWLVEFKTKKTVGCRLWYCEKNIENLTITEDIERD